MPPAWHQGLSQIWKGGSRLTPSPPPSLPWLLPEPWGWDGLITQAMKEPVPHSNRASRVVNDFKRGSAWQNQVAVMAAVLLRREFTIPLASQAWRAPQAEASSRALSLEPIGWASCLYYPLHSSSCM